MTRAAFTGYLAEGATSLFFDTRLALLNPWATAATATFTFSKVGASRDSRRCPCRPGRGSRWTPRRSAGLATAEFSTTCGLGPDARRGPDDDVGRAARYGATRRRRCRRRRRRGIWRRARRTRGSSCSTCSRTRTDGGDVQRAVPAAARARRREDVHAAGRVAHEHLGDHEDSLARQTAGGHRRVGRHRHRRRQPIIVERAMYLNAAAGRSAPATRARA